MPVPHDCPSATLSATIDTWLGYLAARRDSRRYESWASTQVCAKLARVNTRRAQRGFQSWLRMWRRRGPYAKRLHVQATKCSWRRRQSRVLRVWRSKAKDFVKARRGAVVFRRMQLRRAMIIWAMPVAQEPAMHVRALLHRSAMAMRKAAVRRALSSWTVWTNEHLESCKCVNAVLRELKGIGIRRGWYTWLGAYSRRMELRRLMRALFHKMEMAAFQTWAEGWRAERHTQRPEAITD